jgi:hypothetical protein
MLDLSVVAVNGLWVLHDDERGELGAFLSQAEALAAVGDYARRDDESRLVLIQDDAGEWDEALVSPPSQH